MIDILAFGVHPDDVEIGIGGILIKHSLEGYKTVICDLTEAELSSNGTVEHRRKEASLAAKILRVKERINLGFPDRGLKLSPEQIDPITEVIRKYRPSVVLAPHWDDRHPDHVLCGQMVKEAVFNAKLVNKKIGNEKAHSVPHLYFYFINGIGKPDVIVDVSAVYEEKIKALQAYQSQFVREKGKVDTPINDSLFFERVRGKDIYFGHQAGVNYGEGLVRITPLLVPTLI
mgnify:CR=1 FL=1